MLTPLGANPLGRLPLGAPPEGARLRSIIGTSSSTGLGLVGHVLVTTEDYLADIFAWGGGGAGTSSNTFAECLGGGGGAAGYSRLLLPTGSRIAWQAGAARPGVAGQTSGAVGNDTTIAINGVTLTAQGGRAPSYPTQAGQAVATGFQVNRRGGGGAFTGGEGGAGSNSEGSDGQGPGGFNDILVAPTVSVGQSATVGNGGFILPDFGCGGGAATNSANYSTWGGPGRVLILLWQI